MSALLKFEGTGECGLATGEVWISPEAIASLHADPQPADAPPSVYVAIVGNCPGYIVFGTIADVADRINRALNGVTDEAEATMIECPAAAPDGFYGCLPIVAAFLVREGGIMVSNEEMQAAATPEIIERLCIRYEPHNDCVSLVLDRKDRQ
jgi:hypothetical protein